MDAREFMRREEELGHAIQSAVLYELELDRRNTVTVYAVPETSSGSPKHLRVGVNLAMDQHAALVKLLIDKGIIQESDYFDNQILLLENELKMYEDKFGAKFG